MHACIKVEESPCCSKRQQRGHNSYLRALPLSLSFRFCSHLPLSLSFSLSPLPPQLTQPFPLYFFFVCFLSLLSATTPFRPHHSFSNTTPSRSLFPLYHHGSLFFFLPSAHLHTDVKEHFCCCVSVRCVWVLVFLSVSVCLCVCAL